MPPCRRRPCQGRPRARSDARRQRVRSGSRWPGGETGDELGGELGGQPSRLGIGSELLHGLRVGAAHGGTVRLVFTGRIHRRCSAPPLLVSRNDQHASSASPSSGALLLRGASVCARDAGKCGRRKMRVALPATCLKGDVSVSPSGMPQGAHLLHMHSGLCSWESRRRPGGWQRRVFRLPGDHGGVKSRVSVRICDRTIRADSAHSGVRGDTAELAVWLVYVSSSRC